jgi:hypothetical protein
MCPLRPRLRSKEITSWSLALLERRPAVQLLKNFPEFYGNQSFLIMFTKAHHWSPK